MHRPLALAFLLLAAGAAPASAQSASPKPSPELAAALAAADRSAEDRARDARDKPAETLALLGLARGMQVIDLFAGGGYYAELAARVVGENGRAHLHNNAAYLEFAGKELAVRLATPRFTQLVRYDREVEAIDLAPGSIDAALLVMAYHDVYWTNEGWTVTRDSLLAALQRILKPGGRVLVVDHSAAAGTGTSSVQKLHRIDESVEREDFARAGFTLVASSDALRNPADDRKLSVFDEAIRGKTDRFVLVFEKAASPAP
jgi:predicted methyltransferase